MKLVSVYQERKAVLILYDILLERTPEQSISHKEMPTMEEHAAFVRSQPYTAWYLIKDEEYVGSVYLTDTRELGVFIFKSQKGKGYGTQAIREIMKRWPGTCYANINPKNKDSIDFFERLGAKHIQNTYEL